MDHFESIIATLLEGENYWIRRSFRVNLTKEEKRQIGKHSIPRPGLPRSQARGTARGTRRA